jgi:hypothetical protein
MKPLVGIAAMLAILGCAEPGAAQSLAEIAKREAKRRKDIAPAKVYTNSDVRPEPRPSLVETPAAVTPSVAAAVANEEEPPATSASAGGPTPDAATAKVKEPRDETYWRNRALELRGHIQRLRDDIAAVETRQLELAEEPDAAPEYDVTTGALTKLRRNLDAFKGELARFEERARAARVPAEWLR